MWESVSGLYLYDLRARRAGNEVAGGGGGWREELSTGSDAISWRHFCEVSVLCGGGVACPRTLTNTLNMLARYMKYFYIFHLYHFILPSEDM